MKTVFLFICIIIFQLSLFAAGGKIKSYQKQQNKVIFSLEQGKLQLQFYSDCIARVIYTPNEEFSRRKSLSVIDVWAVVKLSISEGGQFYLIKSSMITVKVSKSDASVSFFDAAGKPILQESEGGRIIEKAQLVSDTAYVVRQNWDSPMDEAVYGLGQYQYDVINWHNTYMKMQQKNTAIAMPVVISNKGYGLFWDNYSLTEFNPELNPINLSSIDNNNLESKFIADQSGEYSFVINKEEWNPIEVFCNDSLVYAHYAGVSYPTRVFKLQMLAGKSYNFLFKNADKPVNPTISTEYLRPKDGQPGETDKKDGFLDKVKFFYRSPDMGKTMAFKSQVADQIDYYFIYGENADKIIEGLRIITGKAPLYPKWAYGLFMSQYGWKDQKTIQGVIDGYRLRKIPVDVIVQDMDYWPLEPKNLWGSDLFDINRYPDAQGMVDYLHKKNAHIIISVWPRINQGTDVYDAMNAKNYLLARQNAKGNTVEGLVIKDDSPNAAYDPFNKDARAMYWDFMNKRIFSKGFDGWWMDASEPELGYDFSRAYTSLGSGERYLNAYPLMAMKGVYEGQLSTGSIKRPYILTRSSFVGQQRFATTTRSGDIGPDWTSFRKVIPAGLNFCLTGMPYWTNDIGGFAVNEFVQDPKYPELLVRWFEYGTFLPIFRVHGCRQTPFWNYDQTTQGILLKYTNLRYRLMPYIYTLGAKVTNENFTIHRALMMDFGNDPKVLNIQDQFMFGNEFLVCPVTTKSAASRTVYLPVTNGGWFDFWTGKKMKEGSILTASAPLDRIPLFVKAGAIIPMGPLVQYATESKAETLEIRVYAGADGSFNLYEDEGNNFNYLNGKSSVIPFTWENISRTLTIGDRKGNFAGMLTNRTMKIVIVNESNGIGINLPKKPDKTVQYNGNKQAIQL